MNQSFKHKDDINDMEEQARFQIITVEDNEEIKAKKAKLKQDSDKIIALAKEQLRKLQENEDLRKAVDKGVQVASDTGDWVMQTVSEFRRSENGQKVEAFVNEKGNAEGCRRGIKGIKKGSGR